MSLILVRHGETPLNVARTLQPADTPLSPRGLAQADAVARRLAALSPAGVLSSDLPRALSTAQAIARASGAPLFTTALLHERNFGDLRGQPYDGLALNPLTMLEAPPNGESMQTFAERVALAFDEMLQRRATLAGPLVVVTHGLVIRQLLTRHAALPETTLLPLRIGNTSVSVAEATPPYRVSLLDCTRHLDGSSAHQDGSLSGG